MLTKEKIISTILAIPKDRFEDIEPILDILIELAVEEENDELQEPMIAYGTSNFDINKENEPLVFSRNDAELMVNINNKLTEATDPETIYLIKKIKHSLEDIQDGNFYTVEQAETKINSWFKK